MAPGRKTQEGVPCSPQWDGFLWVLSTSDLELLSIDGVENLEKNGKVWLWLWINSQTKCWDPEWSLGNKMWQMNGKTLLFITKYWISLDLGA